MIPTPRGEDMRDGGVYLDPGRRVTDSKLALLVGIRHGQSHSRGAQQGLGFSPWSVLTSWLCPTCPLVDQPVYIRVRAGFRERRKARVWEGRRETPRPPTLSGGGEGHFRKSRGLDAPRSDETRYYV